MKFKKMAATVAAVTALAFALTACGSKPSTTTQTDNTSNSITYPQKTIKIVSIFPEGRAPVKTIKLVTDVIAKNTGWNFEFEYADGNKGDDAVKKAWSAPHDGHTVLLQTEAVFGNSVAGLTNQTMKDWTFFEVYSAATILAVKPDSQYKTLADIVNAAKAKPGTIKLAHALPAGSAFGLKAKVFEKVTGTKFEIIPGIASQSIVTDLASNKYDAVITPFVIGTKTLTDGQVRVLAMTDAQEHVFPAPIGKVDSVSKAYPEFANYMPLDAPQGLALPKDTPGYVLESFGDEFEKAVNSPELQNYISSQDAIKLNVRGSVAENYVSKLESNIAWLLQDLGLAKVNPETLGITKPKWMK